MTAPASAIGGLALITAAGLSGCASIDPYAYPPVSQHLQQTDTLGECSQLLRDVDQRIDAARARDAQEHRVAGHPWLRVDRFHASMPDHDLSEAQWKAWHKRLGEADRDARRIELANADIKRHERLDECRDLLAAEAASSAQNLALVAMAARVPDDYSTVQRAIGLYPLMRLPFALGIRSFQAETRAVFAQPLERLPMRGRLMRFAPALSPQTAVKWPLRVDNLGVPQLEESGTRALLAIHAPVVEVDVASEHDRIGALEFATDGRLIVNAQRPMAYARVAYTRMMNRVYLQLLYTFWFSARPMLKRIDLLAGRLDGLVWRVTLDHDGTPLLYDTIHPCGCYHLFFPAERVRIRPQASTLDEGLFVPQVLRAPRPGERLVLRVESGTHYIQRVRTAPLSAVDTRYTLLEEDDLRTLALAGGGTRSIYGADGLIAGSERAERFLFWPMGIRSAGQMRQWGHHATAFVGRRHFDDPLLFDRYFEVIRQ